MMVHFWLLWRFVEIGNKGSSRRTSYSDFIVVAFKPIILDKPFINPMNDQSHQHLQEKAMSQSRPNTC